MRKTVRFPPRGDRSREVNYAEIWLNSRQSNTEGITPRGVEKCRVLVVVLRNPEKEWLQRFDPQTKIQGKGKQRALRAVLGKTSRSPSPVLDSQRNKGKPKRKGQRPVLRKTARNPFRLKGSRGYYFAGFWDIKTGKVNGPS